MENESKKKIIVRKPKIQHEEVDFKEMNHTELTELALFCGIKGASRGTPREVLIHCITNMSHVGVDNPMDRKREKLSAFLSRYWSVACLQLPFPATRCPDCWKSEDAQVAYCYIPEMRKGHLK